MILLHILCQSMWLCVSLCGDTRIHMLLSTDLLYDQIQKRLYHFLFKFHIHEFMFNTNSVKQFLLISHLRRSSFGGATFLVFTLLVRQLHKQTCSAIMCALSPRTVLCFIALNNSLRLVVRLVGVGTKDQLQLLLVYLQGSTPQNPGHLKPLQLLRFPPHSYLSQTNHK